MSVLIPRCGSTLASAFGLSISVVLLLLATAARADQISDGDPIYYLASFTATSAAAGLSATIAPAATGASFVTVGGKIDASTAQTGLFKGEATDPLTALAENFKITDGTHTYVATSDIQVESFGYGTSEDAFRLEKSAEGGQFIIYESVSPRGKINTSAYVTLSGQDKAGDPLSITWNVGADIVTVVDPKGTYTFLGGDSIYDPPASWAVAGPKVPEPSVAIGLCTSLAGLGLVYLRQRKAKS